jgi:hypothetical protein
MNLAGPDHGRAIESVLLEFRVWHVSDMTLRMSAVRRQP